MSIRVIRTSIIVGIVLVSLFLWFWPDDITSNVLVQFDPRIPPSSEAQQDINNDQFFVVPSLTIEHVLRADVARNNPNNTAITIRFTGDVAPVRAADATLRSRGMAYAFSGKGIESLLADSDLTVVNLETPLVSDCPVRRDGMTFCGMPSFASAMKQVGIDVVTLANNHTLNYGLAGLKETRQHLDKENLVSAGFNEVVLQEIKGVRFAIIPVNGVGERIDRERVRQLLTDAQKEADVVLVSIHWGAEYLVVPKAAGGVAPDDPQELGRFLVDHGADLVVGAHPHVVQGVEIYKDTLIVYSLGNFIFDQEWSKETKEGVVGSFVFDGKVLTDAYMTPVIIENFVKPRVTTEQESVRILSRMLQSSHELSDK